MSRWFVTGATGFVGGRLARQLRAAGHEVVTIARDPARAGDLVAAGVEVQRGDITDRGSLAAPMKDADGVFHLAAWYKVGARDVRPARAINVDGTRNVLETMRALAIAKGVYTSTIAVFGDTNGRMVDESYVHAGPFLTEYDRTKWLAHYEVAVPLQKAGLPLVIVQPGLVYGPGDTSAVGVTLRQYLRGRLPATPRGTAYCWAGGGRDVPGRQRQGAPPSRLRAAPARGRPARDAGARDAGARDQAPRIRVARAATPGPEHWPDPP